MDTSRPRLVPPDATALDGTSFDDTSHDSPYLDAADGPAGDERADGPDETMVDGGAGVPAAAASGGAARPARSASGGAGGSGGSGGGPRKGGKGGNGPSGRLPEAKRSKYVRRACYVLGVLLFIPVAGFIIVYLMTPIPSTTQPAAKAQQSVFLYSDNKTVIARSGDFDRRPVQLSKVPGPVSDAVISAENRSFYRTRACR